MNLLRRFIQYLAFTVGLVAFANLIVDIATLISDGYGYNLVICLPVVVGGLLALITARAAVSREWQKGPALVIAAAYFTGHFRFDRYLDTSMSNVGSWLELAPWLVAKVLWSAILCAISIVVYRSSDRTLREIGSFLARLLRRPTRPSSLKAEN
jgi:hypothetical protein